MMVVLMRFVLAIGLAISLAGGQAASASESLDGSQRNIQFSNLTTEDGLSSEFIQDQVQDQAGYIWIATQAGLNRFDGHEIRVYEHGWSDETSISHSFVRSLHVAEDGVLWIGTERGINTYEPKTDRFIRNPLGEALSQIRVRKITQDHSGKFWIGTIDSGLISIAGPGEVPRIFRHDPGRVDSIPGDDVFDVQADHQGNVWVASDSGGIARLDPDSGTVTVYRHDPQDAASLSDDRARSLYLDRAGRLWVGTSLGSINRFDAETDSFVRYTHDPDDPHSIGNGQVRSIFEDQAGTLWVGMENGLYEWRPALNGFVNYTGNSADRKSLINDNVNALFQDASGVLWVGTNGGVSSWNYVSDTFRHFASSQGLLSSDVVTSMAETRDGRIWVATYGGGLSRLDLETGAVAHFRHDPDDPASLSDDRVMTVHVDARDRVWAGTRNGGLCRLEPDGTFVHFRNDPDDVSSLSGNAVSRIFSKSDGSLWIGVFGNGLNRAIWQDGEIVGFKRFRNNPEDPGSLSGDRVLSLHEDNDGALWIGTENAGLDRYDERSGSFDRFDLDNFISEDGDDPVSGTPWEIHVSADGTMWIGTLGQGLLRWGADDRAEGRVRFERFGSTRGLASDIYGIVEVAPDQLWLSSSRGLFKFNPENKAVRRFDRTNGLRNNEFNLGARLLSQSGQVVFGGTKGLVAFYPDRLPYNDRPPPIEVVARSRSVILARAQRSQTPQLEIGYFDPFVSFDFVALDFISPDKNQYRYRLRGFDSNWNDARGYRRAMYSSLPAGDYTFVVQASNSDGVWNRDGVAMRLRVTSAPWATSWAYLLYVLVAGAVIGETWRRQRLKRIRDAERQAALELLVTERTAELAERNSDLTLLNRRLEEASVTDQLTGLRNRRYVDQFIEAEVSAVQRRHVELEQTQLTGEARDSTKLLFLLMIDLDGFKLINDNYGHHAGDRALVEVKDRLINCCRDSDDVVRWGGDEFLVFGRASCFAGTKVLAEKLRRALSDRRYHVGKGQLARLSASMGIAAIPFVEGQPNIANWTQIVAIADQGAYLAKANGRDAWVSIRGTSSLSEIDLSLMGDHLPFLVEQGKLVIDSSIEDGINLESQKTLHRASA